MRVSDWSSDVCSSYLSARRRGGIVRGIGGGQHIFLGQPAVLAAALDPRGVQPMFQHQAAHRRRHGGHRVDALLAPRGGRGRRRFGLGRRSGRRLISEARRVGKGGDSPCRTRWAPSYSKKTLKCYSKKKYK